MSHTTRYGNTYTDEEWTEMQEYFKEQKSEENKETAKLDGITKYLKRQLKNEGLDRKQIKVVANLFRHFTYDEANIQWTSQDRKDKIDNLWQRWNIATENLYNDWKFDEGARREERFSILN